jgi:hypothetical protein
MPSNYLDECQSLLNFDWDLRYFVVATITRVALGFAVTGIEEVFKIVVVLP